MKKYVLLGGIFAGCAGIMSLLFLSASGKQQLRSPFVRTFSFKRLSPDHQLALSLPSSYIAGITNSKIYVGNKQDFRVDVLDLALNKFETIAIGADSSLHAGKSQVLVDEEQFYITNLYTFAVYSGNTQDFKAYADPVQRRFHAEAIHLDHETKIIRTFKPDVREFVIALQEGDSLRLAPWLLQKQIDGFFCTDGMMQYDSLTHTFVYVYYYRNEFFAFDNQLELSYRAHTLDTFHYARIQIVENKSAHTTTLTGPQAIVNRKSSVSDGILYINSMVQGQLEDNSEFRDSFVIDAYRVRDGMYQFSFYLPRYNDLALTTFQVVGSRIVTVYGRYLIIYTLPGL